MTISIDFGTLYTIVARSLSVIGKRSTDDNGNRLFADITLGSREKVIISDYFRNALVDLCAELNSFLTAEMENYSGFATVIYTKYWTDQAASDFVSQISASGEYLFNYSTIKLYVSSLSFPFASVTPEENSLFKYEGTFYKWSSGLTQLTAEELASLTDEQKNSATVLSYYNTDPQTVTATSADVYLYYNNTIYKSSRSASFSETPIPSGAALVDPNGQAYSVNGSTIMNIPGGIDDSVTLTLTMPDNWNPALQESIRQASYNYCVSYTLYSWFTVTAPRISEKYLGDMSRNLSAVVRLANVKTAPGESVDILSTSTSVS